MADNVVLSSDRHRDFRVITSRGADYGENVHFVPVIADELSRLVLEYPVCLMKDNETDQFGLYAMLGFEPGENLFLKGDTWDGAYIPLNIRRQPFMVALTAEPGEEPTPEKTVITIDMDSKRVQDSEGESLFNEDGSWTPFLQGVGQLLSGLAPGIKRTDAFIAALTEHHLIEPAQLTVAFADGEQRRFDGLYSVNDEKLRELSGDTLEDLHSKGYLQASYLIIASIGHVQKLIERKNALLAAD